MPFFGPGIGKQDLNFIEAGDWDLALYYLNSIVLDDPQIAHAGSFGGQQQVADARFMDLDPQEIALRLSDRARQDLLAVAEANFQHDGRDAPIDVLKIK